MLCALRIAIFYKNSRPRRTSQALHSVPTQPTNINNEKPTLTSKTYQDNPTQAIHQT